MCYFIPMVPFWTFAFAGQLHIFLKPPCPLKAEKYIWFMCIVYKAKRKKKEEKKVKKYCERKKKHNLIYFGLIFGISFKVFFCAVNIFCQRP